MKPIIKCLLYTLCLLCSPHLWASEIKDNDLNYAESEVWQDSNFWEGALGGLLFHELGHVVLGMSYGGNPHLSHGSIIYPNSHFSPKASMRVSSAGFQAQWLLTELSFVALKNNDGGLYRRYYQGAIAMHLAISTAYLLRLKDIPTSDIYAASNTSHISRDTLAWAIFLPAALDAYRLMGDGAPDWVAHVSLGIKAAEVGYIWQF
ncbi:MAG: hypothetical protein COA61_003330 [Zetaproteobacteria bacterium]|nr:hypothetical protein [Zetaproteobacteria bacterium]